MTEIVTEASKPFYATVGLGSLAVEQAREMSKTVPAEISKLQEQAVAQFKGRPDFKAVQSQVKTLPATVSSQLQTVPATVVNLPTTVKTQFDTYSTKGQEFYVDLVNRGEKLVKTIRRQPATKAAVKDAQDTKASVKGTSTLAKKTTRATSAAVKDASDKV